MSNLGMMRGMMEPFERLVPGGAEPDGLFGEEVARSAGQRFMALLIPKGGGEQTIGERREAVERFSAVVERDVLLLYGDVIRRVSDGAVFRVTGNPSAAPEYSGVGVAASPVERWEVPT